MHESLPPADELPWTISFVIRKRTQIDGFSELPKEKRPPENIIWYGTGDDMDDWFDKVFQREDKKPQDEFVFVINEDDVG